MIKNVFFAAAAIAFLAGVSIASPRTAEAAMTCEDAAKAKYPDSIVDRLKYKHECKKAWKAATGKGLKNKLKG